MGCIVKILTQTHSVNPDHIDEKENLLITPAMITEVIYSAIESHRPRWWEL